MAQVRQCLLNTCQQVGPHLCGDVWCKRRVYSVLRITRKDPDHLLATACQNSIIPGRGLLALRHRVALLWGREDPFLLHSSGQRGVASPTTQGPAPPSFGARVPDPPRNGRRGRNMYTVQASQGAAFLPVVPRRRRAPRFPSLAADPPPRRSRTPGSACPVTALPLHHVRVDASRKCLPAPATAASPKFGSFA